MTWADMTGAAEALAGVSIGFVVGLLGGGGAVLTLPLLILCFDVQPRAATVTSLAVVAVASGVGLLVHRRHGAVRWRTGLVMGGVGAGGAGMGSLLSGAVPGRVLVTGFAVLLAGAGVSLLRRPRTPTSGPRRSAGPVAVVLVATGIGFVTGFLGVGGGFLVVPALTLVLAVPMAEAIGTSLVILLVNAVVSLAFRAVAPPPGVTAGLLVLVCLGAGVGAVLGSTVSSRVPGGVLRRLFGAMVLVVAAATAVQAVTG